MAYMVLFAQICEQIVNTICNVMSSLKEHLTLRITAGERRSFREKSNLLSFNWDVRYSADSDFTYPAVVNYSSLLN